MIYEAMVEAAAENAATTGIIDLVDLAKAGEAGFDVNAFAADAQALIGDECPCNDCINTSINLNN